MCGGGPPPGGAITSQMKQAPPDWAPVTKNVTLSPGPNTAGLFLLAHTGLDSDSVLLRFLSLFLMIYFYVLICFE